MRPCYKETYYSTKKTYYSAKETYHSTKETYVRVRVCVHMRTTPCYPHDFQ